MSEYKVPLLKHLTATELSDKIAACVTRRGHGNENDLQVTRNVSSALPGHERTSFIIIKTRSTSPVYTTMQSRRARTVDLCDIITSFKMTQLKTVKV